MSPVTIYTAHGVPKTPVGPRGDTGPQGPKGDQGPAGPQGAQGAPAPVRRYWRLFGDNTGDNANTNNAVFSTVKSPVFTAPAGGWYKLTANFNVFPGANGTQAALALMVDANVGQMFYFTGDSGAYKLVAITIPLQLTAAQKVTIGYRPVVAGRSVTLVNSNTVVPMLMIEEVGAPA